MSPRRSKRLGRLDERQRHRREARHEQSRIGRSSAQDRASATQQERRRPALRPTAVSFEPRYHPCHDYPDYPGVVAFPSCASPGQHYTGHGPASACRAAYAMAPNMPCTFDRGPSNYPVTTGSAGPSDLQHDGSLQDPTVSFRSPALTPFDGSYGSPMYGTPLTDPHLNSWAESSKPGEMDLRFVGFGAHQPSGSVEQGPPGHVYAPPTTCGLQDWPLPSQSRPASNQDATPAEDEDPRRCPHCGKHFETPSAMM